MTLAGLVTEAATGLADYDGVPAPTDFGDITAEYAALSSGAALLWQPQRRVLRAEGSERVEFFQGQLSNDVRALAEGRGQASLLLSAQGRVEAIFALYDAGESLEITTDAAHVTAVRERLERFLVADDVDLSEEAPSASGFALVGPRAPELLRGAAEGFAEFPAGVWTRVCGRLGGVDARACSRGEFAVPFIEIACKVEAEAEQAWRALAAAGAVPAGITAAEILRVESGVARYGVDVDDSRIALEARLEWAIHFSKGCYVGQEVVERAVSRGRLNRKLVLLASAAPLRVGALVTGGNERDMVTSSVVSPALGPLALAYIDVGSAAAGNEVLVEGEKARVLEWPRAEFYAGRRG
jgi:folate-binding protein YgfZ